ncbi:ABC transporter ATP-binding protein [Kocuria sp.]|uniref:ABC transporter ATP-binding protein n=1 Tax=Kocuria sp. TaxID=1871328 RepID=UPI0026DC7EB5|nr:ABC transporter ATP-binding protein [Kocuria sp.]MDO4918566.1 ABC transporter ATP-binding protein [Kocuria sp.]
MSIPPNGPTTPRREPAPGEALPPQQGRPPLSPPPVQDGAAAASSHAPWQDDAAPALVVRELTKVYGHGGRPAADRVSLTVPRGSFYGLVGRNGAGKTTTLSMATGLLRPTSGTVLVGGGRHDELVDVWRDPIGAKSRMGVLPDGAHLFDRLTGRQLVAYSGLLRGMDRQLVTERTEDLLTAMDLQDAAGRQVQDYSAGMTKKIALAAAMIHAPSLLVLDEPFESVDPVSAANIRSLLHQYTDAGGTVVVSSHVMDLVQRMCDHVAVMDQGRVLAEGTMDRVRDGMSLEDRFVSFVGGRTEAGEGLQWLRPE